MKTEISSIMSLFASGSLAFTAAITQTQSDFAQSIRANTAATRIAQTNGDENSGGNFESFFRALDADGDGTITREEFRKGAMFLGIVTIQPPATGAEKDGKIETDDPEGQTNELDEPRPDEELL